MTKAYPASILKLYQAVSRGETTGFTVPAINLRILTTDTAKLIFRIMQEKKIGPVIFEIARSEQGYTGQPPKTYAVELLAAAEQARYSGPIFIQADHYQFKREVYLQDPAAEIARLKSAISESVAAGFYNIDIDASTLVDLDKTGLDEQQKENYRMTALMAQYISEIQPAGKQLSIGAEIGHIGGRNSTVGDFEAFMQGFLSLATPTSLPPSLKLRRPRKLRGTSNDQLPTTLSKISIQTGTSHGGIPLPDGSMADAKVDFGAIREIGRIAREKYGLAGVVQHGASTLPDEMFSLFPQNGAVEIHLATGWQNLVYDHLPPDLKAEIYRYIDANFGQERKPEWTEEQFVYKMRKKALGPFKQKIETLAETDKKPIMAALEGKLLVVFEKLNLFGTMEVLKRYYNF